jgi:hypothetical protein
MAKQMLFCSMIALAGAVLLPESSAQNANKFKLPAHAQKIEDGAYYLGRAKDRDGREVEGVAFVHPRAGAAKGGGGGKPGGSSTCYSIMASDARWKVIEPYLVDAQNINGLDPVSVLLQIDTGLGIWEQAAGKPIFGALDMISVVDRSNLGNLNGANEFVFGQIDDPGVIAVTIVWGRFSGPAKFRELVEWDMIFDDGDFTFGDAGPLSETLVYNNGIMDFESIFLHEAGHAAGLTHPSGACTEETMYAYASTGETKKRTLNPGDIAGIRALYK